MVIELKRRVGKNKYITIFGNFSKENYTLEILLNIF